jgi:Cu(I)/Ag(I) efflux system membrane fusion protein
MPGATIPPGGPITVIVRPSGAEDSLATVPAAAVVQLPPGTAVFTPLGAGRYAVKWVVAGPAENGKIVVREGVRRGESVVIQGLVPLVQAARDSLDRLGPIAK